LPGLPHGWTAVNEPGVEVLPPPPYERADSYRRRHAASIGEPVNVPGRTVKEGSHSAHIKHSGVVPDRLGEQFRA
jgi:hypothetical protein